LAEVSHYYSAIFVGGGARFDFVPVQGSGAGTILGQRGQDRERQSREREIRFFAEIGVFFLRSLKK